LVGDVGGPANPAGAEPAVRPSRAGELKRRARTRFYFKVLAPERRGFRLRRHLTVRKAGRGHQAPAVPYPVVLALVYRSENVPILDAFLRQCPSNTDVRLWSLDEPPLLPDVTVGSGPGQKFDLVNRLLGAAPIADDAWVVVADDDVLFSRGCVADFLGECQRARLDIAQPGHSAGSHFTHRVTVARPWARVTLTRFVEIGPVFAVAPGRRAEFVPFPDVGMGYGLEVEWARSVAGGARLGVVDQCRVMHLAPVGQSYSAEEEMNRALAKIPGQQIDFEALNEPVATWYRWQRSPTC
jgi:hypothetical protein